MGLTTEQQATLAADITPLLEVGQEFENVPHNSDGALAIAEAYNLQSDPDFWVFLSSVDTDTVRDSLDWTEILDDTTGLTELQRWGFDTLIHNGVYNPSKLSSRLAMLKIFPSTMTNTRASILADATRLATRAEAVMATTASGPAGGDGSAQNDSAIMTFEGDLSYQDVKLAMGW
jgi:hypothetical protein